MDFHNSTVEQSSFLKKLLFSVVSRPSRPFTTVICSRFFIAYCFVCLFLTSENDYEVGIGMLSVVKIASVHL